MPAKTARTSLIPLPDEEHLGPAMRALTEPQRRFVIAMLETGAQDQSRCAAMAGLGGTEGASRVAGCRLAHNPRIIAAIREEADKRLRSNALLGASVMIEIATDPMHKDRFKAADRLLAQAGLGVETVQRHIIEDHRSDREIEEAIILMAQRNGLDPAKLLGKKSKIAEKDVVDAEFEEVSFEGLEDLL